jgi:exonuclease VII large subunit
VEKARQQAEMKRAAQVLSALEELAQKQDANSQDQPDGESPTGQPETSQDKPESAPGPRRGPSNPTDPLGLMQNQAPPATVRPLYRPGPQALSPEQMEQMKELIMRMQQKPAPRGDMRPLVQGSAEQIEKQQLQAQSNTTPSAIDKRLEQVEGRLERIEALLQRLVPESPAKQD